MSNETILLCLKLNEDDQKIVDYLKDNFDYENKNIILLHVHKTIHLDNNLDEYLFKNSSSNSYLEEKITKLENLINLDNITHIVKVDNQVSNVIKQLEKEHNIKHILCSTSKRYNPLTKSNTFDIVKNTNANVTVIKDY